MATTSKKQSRRIPLSEAKMMATTLAKRSKDTSEVNGILTGQGFRQNKPMYTSKPDLRAVEEQHQALCNPNALDLDYKRLYGKQQNLRHLDPQMSEIMSWGGSDPPVKNDFTTDKGAFQMKYKINKMGVGFISEAQDNFRNPEKIADQDSYQEQVMEYLQNQNQQLIKKKIYKNLDDKDQMINRTTEYREQTKPQNVLNSEQAQELHDVYGVITTAGKPRYLERESGECMNNLAEYKAKLIDDIVRGVWTTIPINPQLERFEEIDEKEIEEARSSALTDQAAEQQQLFEEANEALSKEQLDEIAAKLKALKERSRWLPDSAMTTYFGKPAFHAYGNGNNQGTTMCYGDHMKTHNMNPHSGNNKPINNQIHGRALLGGSLKVKAPGDLTRKTPAIQMIRQPIPPRQPTEKFQNMSKKQTAKFEQRKVEAQQPKQIVAQTFKQAKAKQHKIFAPEYTEKHLKTKKQIIDHDKIQLLQQREEIIKKRQSEMSSAQPTGRTIQQEIIASEPGTPVVRKSKGPTIFEDVSNRTPERSSQRSQPSTIKVMSKRQSYLQHSASEAEITMPICSLNPSVDPQVIQSLQLQNPRNYKYLPPRYTQFIRTAGVKTMKSDQVGNIMTLNQKEEN